MNKQMARMKTLFDPKSVAVIGASDKPNKLGFHVMKSLTKGGFPGRIIPVNPGATHIMGLKAFPSIADYDGAIDLAIVVVPAKRVPTVFRECAAKDIKGIVLITAGFKEIDDPEGADLHKEIADIANDAGIPVIGPNTFGMLNLKADLNASFTPEFSRLPRGGITLVSQSGGISHLLGFMAMRMGAGVRMIVGLGNRLNVDFAQMVEYLADDPETRVIVLYVEGIDEARALIDTARKLRGIKPIIAYKTGSGEVGDAASRSHTGSLAGSHGIYMDSFTQAGILHIDHTETLLDTAKALAAAPLPEGPGVAVLSAQAGPSMAACDVCEAEGLTIARFTPETQETINHLLPPLALRSNPVDMGPAWYDAAAIRGIIQTVMDDENVNGILLLMMFASANRDAVRGITDLLKTWKQRKPLFSCIVSPPGIWDDQISDLETSGALINFPTPERAAQAMVNLWRYQKLCQDCDSILGS
ncbi:MAG: CoA-binding protein [Deltaproteobacteria bacterium]|nr:CoA-binding protein [Deltaproteobacteria bacterium]